MRPSSTLCRAQEARQHALAAGTSLANVKGIATLAAAAWAKEALAADKREQRMVLRGPIDDTMDPPALEQPLSEDRSFSENPDRGLTQAGATPR